MNIGNPDSESARRRQRGQSTHSIRFEDCVPGSSTWRSKVQPGHHHDNASSGGPRTYSAPMVSNAPWMTLQNAFLSKRFMRQNSTVNAFRKKLCNSKLNNKSTKEFKKVLNGETHDPTRPLEPPPTRTNYPTRASGKINLWYGHGGTKTRNYSPSSLVGTAFQNDTKHQLVLYANPSKDGTRAACNARLQALLTAAAFNPLTSPCIIVR